MINQNNTEIEIYQDSKDGYFYLMLREYDRDSNLMIKRKRGLAIKFQEEDLCIVPENTKYPVYKLAREEE